MASCSFCPRRGPLGGLSTTNNNQQQQPTKQIPLNCMFFFCFPGFSGRTIAPWIVCFVRLAGGAPPTIAPWIVCFVRLAGGCLGSMRRRVYVFLPAAHLRIQLLHTNLLGILVIAHTSLRDTSNYWYCTPIC